MKRCFLVAGLLAGSRILLVRAMRQVIARPWLSIRLDALLCRLPRLRQRLASLLRQSQSPPQCGGEVVGDDGELVAMTARAWQLDRRLSRLSSRGPR